VRAAAIWVELLIPAARQMPRSVKPNASRAFASRAASAWLGVGSSVTGRVTTTVAIFEKGLLVDFHRRRDYGRSRGT
jgi:hypothetical protein